MPDIQMDSALFSPFLDSFSHVGSWEYPWFRSAKPGHTQETLDVGHPASGRETAVYMILARCTGELSAAQGEGILDALLTLVVTDPDEETFGCMRWFQEETQVWDTNAAFFTLMPFLVLEAVFPHALSEGEWDRVRELCRRTAPWFEREASEAHWYYPNKVVSDVAVLWGVGCFLKEPYLCKRAGIFAEDWIEYTRHQGWGWGENLSLGYIPVILVAVRFLIRSGSGETWIPDLIGLERELLEIAHFCDGKECVPSIRSYNFSGADRAGDVLQWVIGNPSVPEDVFAKGRELPWKTFLLYLLYSDREAIWTHSVPPVPRSKQIRVFNGYDAVSWVGTGIRLGTCSRFPVMPGHYQHETWGLGWQSFPVSALIEGYGVGRLQWRTETGGSVNTHPTTGPNGIYRNYRIFGQNDCAEPVTFSHQEGPLAVVVRSVKHAVLEDGPEVSDEWWFPDGCGTWEQSGAWWVLRSDRVALAVQPLAVYSGTGPSPHVVEVEPVREEGGTMLRMKVLPDTGCLQVCERLETAWVLRAVDEEESGRMSVILEGIHVEDTVLKETKLPRVEYAYVRQVKAEEGSARLSLTVDYHRSF